MDQADLFGTGQGPGAGNRLNRRSNVRSSHPAIPPGAKTIT